MTFDRNRPHNALPKLPPKVELETKRVLKKLIGAHAALAGQRRMLTPVTEEGRPIDRAALLFEPLLFDERPDQLSPIVMKRVFHRLAQAAGWSRSFSFDQRTGEWRDELRGRDG